MKTLHLSRRVVVAVCLCIAAGLGITASVALAHGRHHHGRRHHDRPLRHPALASLPSGPGQPGIFTERCGVSHVAADDPIMDPGKTGESMRHVFFGNVATNASSTAASLRGGATTCATSADSSGYWVPVLTQNGVLVQPRGALIYWLRPRRDHSAIHDMPVGIQIIAGDEMATTPQGVTHVNWSCVARGVGVVGPHTATPHSCGADQQIKLTIRFPSCWDGHTLSGAMQTNVVYPTSARLGCPASHPVQIPEIIFHVTYPISSANGLALSASPTTYTTTDTAHADFINGWTQSILDRDTAECIAAERRCGPVQGPQATPQGPRR